MHTQIPSSVNTIIFDLDGTLLDTLDDLTISVNHCMDQFHFPLHSRDQVRNMVGNGIWLLMERALPQGRNTPEYEACVQEFSSYYKEHMLDHTVPFKGIGPLLSGLSKHGYKMAIVSNKFDAAVKGLCRDFFSKYISVAIGESPTVAKKPAPDTVFQAIRELGADPKQCLYVGDSEVDIQTAKNAGIPCISVSWGFKSREFLLEHHASVIVSSPQELLDEILKRDKQ